MNDRQDIDTVYGKVCTSKRRKQRHKVLMAEHLQDFARNTTLHGLRYITDRGVTRVEKIFWLILFLVSVTICSYQIYNVWVKRYTNPVIVSISERLVPVSEILFPSVTICPQWKISTIDYEYSKHQKNIIDADNCEHLTMSEDVNKFEDVSLICKSDSYSFNRICSKRNYSDVEVIKHIIEATGYVSTTFMMNICIWRLKRDICSSMFSQVLTREGMCYTFNAQFADEIFRKDQIQQNYSYIKDIGKESFLDTSFRSGRNNNQHKGQRSGSGPDLSITFVDNKTLIDEGCNTFFSGYKVYLQHPWDMPQSFLYHYAVLPGQTTTLALKYTVTNTSVDLKTKYSPKERQCYYSDDRPLRYFKTYTENNCKLECLSKYTYHECDCVGFYMPHFTEEFTSDYATLDDNTSDRICTKDRMRCLDRVQDTDAITQNRDSVAGEDTELCNCYPSCDNIEYDAEVSHSEFNAKHYLKDLYNNDDVVKGMSFSQLEIFFKSPRYMAIRRSELFGWTDLIANCGGLLGLFMGFSFLSLVEIIYFITLRLWCTIKSDSEDEKVEDVQDYERNP